MGNPRSGWIKLHRQIMDHPFYEESRIFSRHEAWEYLLLNANHAPGKVLFDGQLIEVERGSFITSIRKLQERWKWSNTKVVRFLDVLEMEGMASVKRDTKKTVISIDKYGFFQGGEDAETTEKRHSNDAETTQKHTNKKNKEEREEKEEETRELPEAENGPSVSQKISDFRHRYSSDQLKALDQYIQMLRHTRTSGKLADSIILKAYEFFDKFPPICVEYAVRTHTDTVEYHSRKENYTFGILRNTSSEEAAKKLSTRRGRDSEEAFLRRLEEMDSESH